MKKKIVGIVGILVALATLTGCTSTSTKLAQAGSFRAQAVTDGVHRDVFNALARENYEVAKLNVLLQMEKLKAGMPPEVQTQVDRTSGQVMTAFTSFAKKRDFMLSWDRDHERANALKYVTVDAKLFSEQGIVNYLFGELSAGSKKLFDAWDAAKDEFKKVEDNTPPTTSPF